ncbi:salicylate 1-monooxygenase [Streptomyces lincolnensis]|uniref:2,3-dihydro-2,3-dihydroxybenzoate dehydrogenase n=1 Tax=Streptomyces lincolnensis TaxID=1915 RepID=A0A1B1MGJ7_STRLN|nr:2,3-dihydro-2,3-dihydroxybenzoate dehydrogenase [Streptomyces lincolnensis]ANS67691.1 salicylate 1-monooxygenase [Streptomyces lincolnensis]AXG55006.1 salicylate 1-monooxygenase [Streptomyces lincolnensis]
MKDHEPRIAVIGAGISGLVLAAALHQQGIRTAVFEQAGQLFPTGAGIQLSPNAVRLLHRLGLEARLRQHAVRPRAIRMTNWDDGHPLATTPLAGPCEERYGAPYLTVHRADLHAALLEQLPMGTLRLGARCLALDEREDGVRLEFADGLSYDADLVVGADGIRSVVRSQLFPDRPRFSGQGMYRGLVPADRVPRFAADPRVQLWLGPGQHCVAYPVSGGRTISFAAGVPAPDWRTESWTQPGRKEDLLAAYTGWDDELLGLLSAADEVTCWALHDRDPLDHLVQGRFVLIGDAAHPMLPFLAQGANQAVEDAAVLADCLIRTSELPAALGRYEMQRLPRANEVQRRARANNDRLHLADGEARQQRDRELAARQGLESHDWLFAYEAVPERQPDAPGGGGTDPAAAASGISGRVALITGAARGIGFAVARALAQHGARVVLTDLDRDGLDEAVKALADEGQQAAGYRLDVQDSGAVAATVEAVEQEVGPVDILVNVAGVLHTGPVAEFDDAHWQQTFAVNAFGVFCVSREATRRMAERERGVVVTVASNAGTVPRIHMAAYGASKAASVHFTKVLGLELAGRGIRCNVVSPGSTRTPMLEQVQHNGSEGTIRGDLAGYRTGIPLRRIAEPEDVASAVVFLASDEARHITMHELSVDGGAALGA